MSSVEEMRTLLDSEEFDFRYEIGVAQSSQNLSLRDSMRIVKSCAAHFTVHSVKAELDQICDGLNCMGVLQFIRENPALLHPLFLPQPSAPLTADYMIIPFATKFSPPGSNSREEEEAVVMKWVQFLQAIEGIHTEHLKMSTLYYLHGICLKLYYHTCIIIIMLAQHTFQYNTVVIIDVLKHR